MIRAIAELADGGTAILLGLTAENLKRLRDDRPIRINLGELLVEAFVGKGEKQRGKLELVILYGETHRDVIEDFRAAGIPLPDDAIEQATAIDESL